MRMELRGEAANSTQSDFHSKKVLLSEHCFLKSSLPEIKNCHLRGEKETLDSAVAGCAISQELVPGHKVNSLRLKFKTLECNIRN